MEANIQGVVQSMAQDILKVMQFIMDTHGLSNSNIRNQMQTRIEENDDGVVVSLLVNFYIHWLINGRKPTNYPPITRWENPVGDIRDWCKRKGLPSDNKTVWAIIKHIHKFGYKKKFDIEEFWIEAESKVYDKLDVLFNEIVKELTDWFNE